MKGFAKFIREKGVVGLAVGFILGGAISKVVSSFVDNIINPLLSVLIGATGNFDDATFMIGDTTVGWGNFVSTIINFIVITLVVYLGVKILKLDELDKK